ncbi:unnamed protein product, partial [Prorocentrum cordatum]
MAPAAAQRRFLVATAFDTRYEVGYLCSTVNEAYCQKHGYEFRRVLPAPEDMAALAGGRHSAWAKVALMLHLLGGDVPEGARRIAGPAAAEGVEYVVWVDADAMFLDHDRRLEHYVDAAHGADFVIGEDMADTDLLNTGLFLCRAGCAWARELLARWWRDSDPRWHHEVCWDQTGLCRLLEEEDGLGKVPPWFSWSGGTRRKACGGHTFVFDCGSFNFKYVNNSGFVFHAVGERELLFSFSRSLSTKRERIYGAVQEGFVSGGVDFERQGTPGSGPSRGSAHDALRDAHLFWQKFGVGRRGAEGRHPPLCWAPPPPPLPASAGAAPECNAAAAGPSGVAEAMRHHFAGGASPLVLRGGAGLLVGEEARRAAEPRELARRLGGASLVLRCCAPPRATDVVGGRPAHTAQVAGK